MQLLVVLMLVLVAGLHDANAFSVARKQRQPMKPIKNLGLAYTQPEQIHISYGTRADQMVSRDHSTHFSHVLLIVIAIFLLEFGINVLR